MNDHRRHFPDRSAGLPQPLRETSTQRILRLRRTIARGGYPDRPTLQAVACALIQGPRRG